jgi:hypothetical protein
MTPSSPISPAPISSSLFWDRRYREGSDGWELGMAAPPLRTFLCSHWLLALFWCHRREGGPPFGSEPEPVG